MRYYFGNLLSNTIVNPATPSLKNHPFLLQNTVDQEIIIEYYALFTYPVVTQEVCNMERLNVTCPPHHVILMTSAFYGRMRVGRCVKGQYGVMGCKRSMLEHLDRKCSGKRTCHFLVPDDVMHASMPCHSDLTSNLEVAYRCITSEYSCLQHNLLL